MPERIYKLQPNRTVQLRGFNDLGAAAALHSATESGFTVSGVFRDPADFCVLTLFDADNFFEHPALRYLPDTNFDGLTLKFDVRYEGLRNLDSPRWRIIDWPYLDVIRPDASIANVPLFEGAELVGGARTPASAKFTILDNGLRMWDRVSIWYLNRALDYLVTDPVETAYAFQNIGEGATHWINVAGTVYSYTQPGPEFDITVAQRLLEALAPCPHVTAVRTMNQLDIRVKPGAGEFISISASSAPEPRTLRRISASSVAAELARQCNETPWAEVGADIPIAAAADGPEITFTAATPGEDGNALSMYAVAKNAQLTTLESVAPFTGGSSAATWRVTINFRDRGVPQVRKMWLTFAPPIANGRAFEPLEWKATFTNWTVEGPEEVRRLRVAGPGSLRIEESSSACEFDGLWIGEHGFYSSAYAKVGKAANSSVTIGYDCPTAHELWLGTSLYSDRGAAALTIDGVPHPDCDTRLNTGNDPAVITRKRLAGPLPPGRHVVTLRTLDAQPFYFDFLDIVVPSDVPDKLPARTNISPALDYSTDHTYKLPPARILWMLDKLGFAGPMNEYLGVFWWNQRKRVGARIPQAAVTFTGEFKEGDRAELNIAGTSLKKTVLSTDNAITIARHFACYVNATFVGLWASASDNVLTLTSHSPAQHFHFDFTHSMLRSDGSTGEISVTGSLRLTGGDFSMGDWIVDPSQTPALNRGARDWHLDFFRECKAYGRELVVAASMELVMPPDDFPARYHNGEPVKTDVGYGSNWWSSHCAFNAPMLEYQKLVFGHVADLMAEAGLTPDLQFGEFCWWYFNSPVDGTMALYDADTTARAAAQLGRPLAVFHTADDDPMVNGGADALFLRNALRDYVAALVAHVRTRHPEAKFEVLFPYDVNYPRPAGKRDLGGRLLRFINFPAEWESPQTAGFHRLKMEGLDWGALTRDLDLVRDVLEFPLKLGWPRESVRYMSPIFNGGCPWVHEYRLARRVGIPVVNWWAFDHVCIFGLPVREPGRPPRSVRF